MFYVSAFQCSAVKLKCMFFYSCHLLACLMCAVILGEHSRESLFSSTYRDCDFMWQFLDQMIKRLVFDIVADNIIDGYNMISGFKCRLFKDGVLFNDFDAKLCRCKEEGTDEI